MTTELKRLHEIIDGNFDEQVKTTQNIIRIKSVLDEQAATTSQPFGPGTASALEAFLAQARAMGFETKNLGNYVGYADLGDNGELIGILAHLDVVPEGTPTDWKHPPYSAVIDGGELWGRGSNDDKGPAVAALYAMAALRGSGAPLKKRFRLILGLDEESGSRCIKHYNEKEEIPVASFSPDAYFPVVNAEKGIVRITVSKKTRNSEDYSGPVLLMLDGGDRFNVVPDLARAVIACSDNEKKAISLACDGLETKELPDGVEITARGVSAHAMEPEKGKNAVQKLLSALVKIDMAPHDTVLLKTAYKLAGVGCDGAGLGIACSDEVSGPLTCNLAAVSVTKFSDDTVMSFKLDIRYPVTAKPDFIMSNIEKSCTAERVTLAVETHKKSLYMPETHKMVRTILDAYEALTGDRPKPISMGGGTYCRFMPNSVSAGPLFPDETELAHQPNERVSLDSLRRSTHIYGEIIARLNILGQA